MSAKGFFAIDSATWHRACDLGINPAIAALVMARGTGPDNRTTNWSTNAIEGHTGISRLRAAKAIRDLIEVGIVTRAKGGNHPRYVFEDHCDGLLWLPNSIVDGIAAEIPPVELLRQTRNVAALRLLPLLYGEQQLHSEGGIEWRGEGMRRGYARERVFTYDQYVVWGFNDDSTVASPRFDRLINADRQTFAHCIRLLTQLGLLEFIPHLVDSASLHDAELIHPLTTAAGEDYEMDLGIAMEEAIRAILEARKPDIEQPGMDPCDGTYDAVALVPSHIEDVQLVGIARLRYRPLTRATKAWLNSKALCEKTTRDMENIASQLIVSSSVSGNMQYQREIKVVSR